MGGLAVRPGPLYALFVLVCGGGGGGRARGWTGGRVAGAGGRTGEWQKRAGSRKAVKFWRVRVGERGPGLDARRGPTPGPGSGRPRRLGGRQQAPLISKLQITISAQVMRSPLMPGRPWTGARRAGARGVETRFNRTDRPQPPPVRRRAGVELGQASEASWPRCLDVCTAPQSRGVTAIGR